jgi:selenocysteine lyase/cysteine desulfurase
VPTQGGLVQPAERVGALCRAAGVPMVLDACQSAGQLGLDVQRIGCDVLSGTGRKFLRGPRGTGFLYVRRELIERLEPPFLDLHAAEWVGPDEYRIRRDARRFENWESAAASKIGLGVAVDYALAMGLDAIEARAQALAAGLRERLVGLPGIAVHDRGVRRCAIVSFTIDGVGAADVAERLRNPPPPAPPVNVTVAALEENRLDLGGRGLDALVRASPHYYNTEAELDAMAERVGALARAGHS